MAVVSTALTAATAGIPRGPIRPSAPFRPLTTPGIQAAELLGGAAALVQGAQQFGGLSSTRERAFSGLDQALGGVSLALPVLAPITAPLAALSQVAQLGFLPGDIADARAKARRKRRAFMRNLDALLGRDVFEAVIGEAIPGSTLPGSTRGVLPRARALRRPPEFDFGLPVDVAVRQARQAIAPGRIPGTLPLREAAARFGTGPTSQAIRQQLNEQIAASRSIFPAGGQVPSVFSQTGR